MPQDRDLRHWWRWSTDDRQKFRRRLRRASPYILILLMPGSFVLLPVYALWRQWLRKRRSGTSSDAKPSPD